MLLTKLSKKGLQFASILFCNFFSTRSHLILVKQIFQHFSQGKSSDDYDQCYFFHSIANGLTSMGGKTHTRKLQDNNFSPFLPAYNYKIIGNRKRIW